LWPLAQIQGRSCGAIGTMKMPPTITNHAKPSVSAGRALLGAFQSGEGC